MIRPPRRSVTRFFIPMIDVLTLLFCIFLLMPFVKSAGEGEAAENGEAAPKVQPPPGDPKELAKKIEQLQREIERVKKDRDETIEKLSIHTLEIGNDDGKLRYLTGAGPMDIRNQADAERLIENHRKEARRAGRELYYLFLYPRTPSAFPTEEQVTNYQHWFKGVPHGFDNPRAQD